MYPNLYYLFKDLFNVEIPFLSTVNSFGLFVTIAFFVAAWLLTIELKRKEALGQFDVGTANGKLKILPSETVPIVTIIAAFTGILGARIFNILKNPVLFFSDPINTMFSSGGLVFYGGLIFATIAIWIYYERKQITPLKVADAVAPSLMPAYAIGRIGCHVAGDGDWGIVNLNPKSISWLPDWLWAYNYPHNIIRAGSFMQKCDWGTYCTQLNQPVYPTPLYECIIIFILFFILWALRKKINTIGRISAIYLIFISTERFFIEMIRITQRYNFLGITLTQAQIISVILFAGGIVLYVLAPKLKVNRMNL